MKYLAFAVVIILLFALAFSYNPDAEVTGKLKIPAHDIRTAIMAVHGEGCGCCPSLWNGGIVHALEDLSAVQVGDTADLTTLDGGHLVLECVEITPCIHIGHRLISWKGIVKDNGDVLIFNNGMVYRFTIL